MTLTEPIEVRVLERFPVGRAGRLPATHERAIVEDHDGKLSVVTMPLGTDGPLTFEAAFTMPQAGELACEVLAGDEWVSTHPDTLRVLAAALLVVAGKHLGGKV